MSEEGKTMIIENVGPATRMITLVCKDAVYYSVEHLDIDNLGQKEWVTVWSKTVPFLKDKAHHPGGKAFEFAAKLQAGVAAIAGEPGEA